jgi:hypothetical protein
VKTKYKAPLALALGAGLFTTTPARADVKISDVDGWQFSTNGRVNAFLSYVNADGYPSNVVGQTHNFSAGAGLESNQLDNSDKINSFRLRSGFVAAVLGFTVRTQLDEQNVLKAHIETWNTIETQRQKAAPNPTDVREAWGKVEGPWGSLLFGRALALFSRGAITLDYTYQHAYGLGYPCTVDGGGPTCGQVGYGVVFAGYNPQITYSTPVFSGLQINAGLFDPTNAPGKLERTPLPRVESEATYDYAAAPATKLHVFLNGMWQKLEEKGNPAMPSPIPLKTTSARGVNYGFWAELWKFRIGYSSHVGYGIGMNNTLENTPVVFDSANNPRKFDAYYGVVGLELGKVYLNVGAGVTRLFATDQDKKDAQMSQQDPIKTQRGISGGINYMFSKNLIADVDYFNAKHTWYLGDTQSVNVLNAGLTIAW